MYRMLYNFIGVQFQAQKKLSYFIQQLMNKTSSSVLYHNNFYNFF
jgi:hypothetical protein